MALSYSMHSNDHTTRTVEITFFCTSTTRSLWSRDLMTRKVSLSSVWSSHEIYFQPRDRSGYKELDMAMRLFTSGGFLLLVWAGWTCESTHCFLSQVLKELFPSPFPPSSKEKVVITINLCKIMAIFVDRSHFHQSIGLWSWHEKDATEFTKLLLHINTSLFLSKTFIPGLYHATSQETN